MRQPLTSGKTLQFCRCFYFKHKGDNIQETKKHTYDIPQWIRKTIGNIIYEVLVHFSQFSTESAYGKLKRNIINDCVSGKNYPNDEKVLDILLNLDLSTIQNISFFNLLWIKQSLYEELGRYKFRRIILYKITLNMYKEIFLCFINITILLQLLTT